MNLLKLYSDCFQDNWDEIALRNYDTGLTLTYCSLAARMLRIHMLLNEIGVEKGTRVGIVGHNSIDWVTNFMSTITYGAVAVSPPATYEPEQLLSLLGSANIQYLFIDEDLMPDEPDLEYMGSLKLIMSMDSQRVLARLPGAPEDAQNILDNLDINFTAQYPTGVDSSHAMGPVVKGEDLTAIFFTSGTTGEPRPVLLSADNLEGNIIYGIRSALFPQQSVAVTTSGLGHVWCTIFNVLVPLASGAAVSILKDYTDTRALIKSMMQSRPIRVMLSPQQIKGIYYHLERKIMSKRINKIFSVLPFIHSTMMGPLHRALKRAFGGRCQEVIIGATAIGPQLLYKLHRAGVNYTIGYGLVECGGLASYTPHNLYKAGTVGHAIKNMIRARVRPLDIEGLPDGVGILELHGMTVMKGYSDNDRSAFTTDGWFVTGDLATIDPDGEITLWGNMDTLLHTPAGVIVPERIEKMLLDYQYIKQCVIVERDGVLTALIHPDYNAISQNKIYGNDPESLIMNILSEVNRINSFHERIDAHEIMEEPMMMTPKGNVVRYMYF